LSAPKAVTKRTENETVDLHGFSQINSSSSDPRRSA
jgi:hypothetical protein